MNIAFTRRTDLALAALRSLAGADGRLSRSGLAEEIGTTSSFLSQVMAPLVRSGWVISERGPGGGYLLADSALQAKLLEVIEATERETTNGRCVLREGPCPGQEPCAIHAVWAEAKNTLVEGLEKIPAVQVTRTTRRRET